MFRLFVLVLAGKVSADVTWCFNLLETDRLNFYLQLW